NPVPVGRRQCGGNVGTKPGSVVRLERSAIANPHGQIRPVHVLHDHEAPDALFEEVVHAYDVAVNQTADRLDFAAEPLTGQLRARGWRDQQLDGDGSVETAIGGEIDDRKAAPSELAHDLVATGEQIAGPEVGGTDHDPPESR